MGGANFSKVSDNSISGIEEIHQWNLANISSDKIKKEFCDVSDIKKRKSIIGSTGYIDQLPDIVDDEEFAVKGVDAFGRPFFAIKGFVCLEKEENKNDTLRREFFYRQKEDKFPFFQTFFQRYTNGSPNLWMGCGKNHDNFLFYTDGGLDKRQAWVLKTLLTDGKIVIKSEYKDLLRLCCFPNIKKDDPREIKIVLSKDA